MKRRAAAIKHLINQQQVGSAQQAYLFFNANRKEETDALESYSVFLPYPEAKLNITSIVKTLTDQEAREVLSIWDKLPFYCTMSMDKFKADLVAISRQLE